MKSDTSTYSTSAPARTPTYEEISRRAYELWEKDGRPEGNEQQHWYQAEKELSQGNPASASTTATAPNGAAKPVSTSSSSPNAKPRAGKTGGVTAKV